ncbi:MAG: (Fe-S)-binding protein [archaeon]
MDVLGKKIFGKTLFYPGCILKYKAKKILQNYEEILGNLRVNYVRLHGIEQCCGSPVLSAGYTEDFKRVVDANMQVFKDQNISRIITVCSGCHVTFLEHYPNLKIEHVTQVIGGELNKLLPKRLPTELEEVTYFEPCKLGSKLNIHHEPRAILQRLGYAVKELDGKASCCGAGGGLKMNSPNISNRIAQQLLAKVKTPKLVTACPNCYLHLKENATDVEVLELSELMLE